MMSTELYKIFEGIQDECLIVLSDSPPLVHRAAEYYKRFSKKGDVVNYRQFLETQLTAELLDTKTINQICSLNAYIFYLACECILLSKKANLQMVYERSTFVYYADLVVKNRPHYLIFKVPDLWLPNNSVELK